MAHTNEEIYLSYLCDRIMAVCNRLNKRLDMFDEQQHTNPAVSYHEQPSWHVATAVPQLFYTASFYQPDGYPLRPDPDPPYAPPAYANHAVTLPPNQPPQPAIPPPPLQRSSSCWSPTSHCRSVVPLPAAAVVPSFNRSPPALSCSPDVNGEEGKLLNDDPPSPAMVPLSCSPDIIEQTGEGDALLEYGEDDGFLKASSLSPMPRREALECIQIGSNMLENQVLNLIGEELGKTPTQVVLHWGLHMGHNLLSKSTNERRIKENIDVFDWIIPHDLCDMFFEIEQVFDPGGFSTLIVASWFPP